MSGQANRHRSERLVEVTGGRPSGPGRVERGPHGWWHTRSGEIQRPRTRTSVVPLVLLMVLGGCSVSGAAPRGGTSSTITFEQVQGTGAVDAFEVIQRLRPAWLRSRAPLSFQDQGGRLPVVYVDDVRYGGPDTLRQILLPVIDTIDFIDALDATTRFGTGHAGGVILVTTRR